MADWRKAVGWTTAIIGALLLVIVVGGVLLLRSSAFHRYLISKIVQQGSEATGARIDPHPVRGRHFSAHNGRVAAEVTAGRTLLGDRRRHHRS